MTNRIIPCILFAAAALFAADWYTRYENTDNGAVAHFDFNNASLQDKVSRRSAVVHGAAQAPGWKPAARIVFDGTGKGAPLADESEPRAAFTLVVRAKVTAPGYLVLKKGEFGLGFDGAAASLYLRLANKRDFALAAPATEGWHNWIVTADGTTAVIYRDGVKAASRGLPAPFAHSDEPILLANSGGWKKTHPKGEMAFLRLLDRAITPQEAAAITAELADGRIPAPDAAVVLTLPVGAKEAFIKDDVSYEARELALHFDGKSAYAVLPDYPALQKAAALTVGAWIKPEHTRPKNINEQGYIVSQNAGAHYGWGIGTYYSDGLHANIITDQGSFGVSASHVLVPRVWQHVAFSWDGRFLQLFVNGRQVGQSVPTRGKLKPYKARVHLGRAADRDGLYFKGAIDEVRIMTAALTSTPDPDLGKPVVTPASNTDPTPLEKLPPFRAFIGKSPEYPPLFDFEDLTGWTTTVYHGFATAALVRSQDDRFWGDYTGKLTFQAGSNFDPARKVVLVKPPRPIPVTAPFSGVELCVSAQNWGSPTGTKIDIEFQEADGKTRLVPLATRERPFIFWSGWGLAMAEVKPALKLPAALTAIRIHSFGGSKPETLYLDNLALYRHAAALPDIEPIPTWPQLGVRPWPQASMPVAKAEVGFTQIGTTYRWSVVGGKDRIVYSYTPKTGTLSDLTATFNGGRPFHPLANGGFTFVLPDGTTAAPGSPRLKADLKAVRLGENGLAVRCQWLLDGKPFAQTELKLHAERKTLAIQLLGGDGKAAELTFGAATGLASPVLTTVPYWVLRGGKGLKDPALLYADGMLMTVFDDIYSSNASELFGGSAMLPGSAARLNGGARYNPLTNGRRNEADETFYLTLSSELPEVLPHIPNPPNPTMPLTRNAIWVTRMWYDKMPCPDYFPRAFEMLRQLHRYGVRNLIVRDHGTLNRQYSPKRRGDGMVTEILPDIGGDAACAEYLRRATDELGYRMGLYSNYTLLHTNNPAEFTHDRFTLDVDGNPRYGSGATLMTKYACLREIQRQVNGILKSKFKLTCTYPDQYTCRAPWAFTDYDARVPEAGKFSPALRVLADSLLIERKDFQIALSEGISQWPLAGFCDSYAQPGNVEEFYFPEFQLRKIHLLSNDCGTHLTHVAKYTAEDVDRLLADQFAFGTIGHIYGIYSRAPRPVTYATLKSHYIPRQTQKWYAGVPVKGIRYHHQGKMLTAVEAVAAQSLADNQIRIQYESGLEVWVNGPGASPWTIDVRGAKFTLPPCGYYAELPGKVLTYSVLRDGRRVDFSLGDEYLFANGNGVPTDFGPIRCAGAYAILFENGAREIIPLPGSRPETVSIDLRQLPGGDFTQIVALDGHRKELSRTSVTLSSGKLVLKTAPGVFSYLLR